MDRVLGDFSNSNVRLFQGYFPPLSRAFSSLLKDNFPLFQGSFLLFEKQF